MGPLSSKGGGASRLSSRVTSALRLKKGVSQTHWESRPELVIDLNLEPSESCYSEPEGKPVG